MRTKRLVLAGVTGCVLAAGLAMALVACESTVPSRAGKLLTMAAEEAGMITDSLEERLTRQLNVADMQIQAGQKPEAIKTLGLALATLHVQEKDAKTLDDFKRISGWASLAELYHRAGDDGAGTKAYYDAYEALKSVQPVAKRAEYVLSLSEVCEQFKGKVEAARLLEDGGSWAGEIKDQASRRFALSTFAGRLIDFEDYKRAQTVMRFEADARWRSDTLAAMARQAMAKNQGGSYLAGAKSADSAAYQRTPSAAGDGAAGQALFRNANVQYDFNYRKQEIQQGIIPR